MQPENAQSRGVSAQSTADEISVELSSRRTGMSFQRTRLSADRTLMSVTRTSLALILTILIFALAYSNLALGMTPWHATLPESGSPPALSLIIALILLGLGILAILSMLFDLNLLG